MKTRTAEETRFSRTLSALRAIVREVEIPASEWTTCVSEDFDKRMSAVLTSLYRVDGRAYDQARFACPEWSGAVRSLDEANAVIDALRKRFFAAVEMQRYQRSQILQARASVAWAPRVRTDAAFDQYRAEISLSRGY